MARGSAAVIALQKYSKLLAKKLTQGKQTLGLAESCTGGLLASSITALPGVSIFFLGSVVCYANQAKRALLGVPEGIFKKHGAVSPETARLMAQGARKVFRSTWALGITGVAGPTGGTKKKPV